MKEGRRKLLMDIVRCLFDGGDWCEEEEDIGSR